MKKLTLLLALFLVIGSAGLQAQTTPAKDSTKTHRKSKTKQPATAPSTATTTPATTAPATPAPATPAKPAVKTPSAPAPAASAANKSADKAVGTDAKGRTIYEGPRGGRYVLTANGNKEYLKKTN